MNLFTSHFQQEIRSEEEWEEAAAGSFKELADKLGVKPSWVRGKMRELFGFGCADQSTVGDGQYRIDEAGRLRFIPGGRKTWITRGQAAVLEHFAAEHRHKMVRRNGPVIRLRAA